MNSDLFKPLTPLAIGVTPLLAVCTTLVNGVFTGVAYFLVLILTGLTVSSIKLFIPLQHKLIYLLLITATWVSIIDLIFQAYVYPVRNQLGIYIHILAMNTSIIYFLEETALRRRFNESGMPGIRVGVAAGFLFISVGLIREILSNGGILTDVHVLFDIYELNRIRPVYFFDAGLSLFNTTAGAFIVFGLLLAVLRYFQIKHHGNADYVSGS